jgi:MYXO-CTERM domain-containing protein
MTTRVAPFLLALALAALWPATALAGACPTCTTSADCTNPEGGPVFCVLHDGDVGCGSARQICCPGQACSIEGGRPSCEARGTCSVVGEADAGAPPEDAAVAPTDDAAVAPTDDAAVAPTEDAGTVAADGGSPMRDAGGTPSTSSSGCGCRAGAPSSAPWTLLALAGLALAVVTRRRGPGTRAKD